MVICLPKPLVKVVGSILLVWAGYAGKPKDVGNEDTLLSMRKKSGLTQDEIAKKMGTQKGNISRLERGNSNPSWKTLQNYAHACGFELSMKVRTMHSEHVQNHRASN